MFLPSISQVTIIQNSLRRANQVPNMYTIGDMGDGDFVFLFSCQRKFHIYRATFPCSSETPFRLQEKLIARIGILNVHPR